MAQWR